MARIQGLLLAMLVALVANRAEAAHCGSATYACCAGIAKCEEQSAYVTYRRECKTCYKLVPTCVTETVSRPGCKEIEELCVKNVPTTCYKDVVETCYQNVRKTVYKNVACTEWQNVRRVVEKPVVEHQLRTIHYTVCKPVKTTVMKEEIVAVCRPVQETKYKECHYTVCVPVKENKVRECSYVVCRPVTTVENRTETYVTCVPRKVYRTVSKEVSATSSVREYLAPRRFAMSELAANGAADPRNCDNCPGGRQARISTREIHRLLAADPCASKCVICPGEDPTCTSSDGVCEVPGCWVQRPVVCKRTITCQIPCTVMERQTCSRVVACQVTRMVKEHCVKQDPYVETRYENRHCVKKVPYCETRMVTTHERRCVPTVVCKMVQQECSKQVCEKVCKTVREECIVKQPVTTNKSVPVEVCEKVPYTVTKKVPYTVCQKVNVKVVRKVPCTVREQVSRTVYKKVPYVICVNVPEIHCPPLCVDTGNGNPAGATTNAAPLAAGSASGSVVVDPAPIAASAGCDSCNNGNAKGVLGGLFHRKKCDDCGK